MPQPARAMVLPVPGRAWAPFQGQIQLQLGTWCCHLVLSLGAVTGLPHACSTSRCAARGAPAPNGTQGLSFLLGWDRQHPAGSNSASQG